MQFGRVSWSRADWGVALLLGVVTVAYIYTWPRDLYKMDEGLFLYGAKRILEGDVIYRDFFEIITPGSFYAMALLYWAFGVDMATARMGMAVLHAAQVIVIYLSCRLIGVRTLIAALAAFAHVAISYPAATIASPHWFGTALILLVQLAFLLRLGRAATPWSALFPGLLTGLLCSVQQQKGAVFVAAGALLIATDWLVAHRYRAASAAPLRSLVWFGVGVTAVVLIWLVPLLALAGPRILLEDLVYFALFNYLVVNQRTWGTYVPWMPNDAFPWLIYAYPILFAIALLRTVADYVGAKHERQLRARVVLLLMSGGAVLSILYVPDYFHLAVIAPVFFVLGGETSEAILARLEQFVRLARPVADAVAVVFLIALALQAQANLQFRRHRYPFSHQTAFGRVDFRNPQEIILIDKVRELTRGDRASELFCYPSCASLYLTTGTKNPTAFQQLIPVYNNPEAFAGVFATLDARRVPYVVVTYSAWTRWRDDPMRPYLGKHYLPVRNVNWGPTKFREFSLFYRNPETTDGSPN